jgi:pimeloyl-ACP methyl ester carboxylesterase
VNSTTQEEATRVPNEEVTFYSGGCAIAGTFTEAADPVAAALLITGGGKSDRNSDARLPGGQMLRIGVDKAVAGALAGARVCALRYDKRGVGASGGEYLRAGMDDQRADARAALGWLAARAGGLPLLAIGHSEGAWYAAELAADHAVAGAVLLAGGARPAEEILSWQNEMVAARLPATARLILKITRTDIIRSQRKRVARIKASTGDVIRIQGFRMNARWWRDFLAYDPRPALARIAVPVLAITGGQDVQVPPQDVAEIGRLAQGPFEGHVTGNLSHLFRPDPASAGLRAYRRAVREPVDAEVLKLITSWITTRWAASPRPAAQSPVPPPHADHV